MSLHTIVSWYQWLEANNLWKATVAFSVTVVLSGLLTLAMRPRRAWQQFQEHKATQARIADQLDTTTPGGMTDLVNALYEVLGNIAEDPPDDNGTDGQDFPVPGGRKKGGHSAHAEPHAEPHASPLPFHLPGPLHGGPTGHGR